MFKNIDFPYDLNTFLMKYSYFEKCPPNGIGRLEVGMELLKKSWDLWGSIGGSFISNGKDQIFLATREVDFTGLWKKIILNLFKF